ncbi:enoyl-CoA hydratase-related protein [Thioclava electrotropha]|uniref:enoyl-CoA hydratase-related protein n=1 Tax=Thioclava electrotropha TaxID=1549850 RepID=UPI0023A90636|nr:enoyl-CoA hydratase-related protein [Thioclava electrotropha]
MNRRRAQQTSFPEMCREAMGDYGDCCANQANADPARCADGYYPSHQPQSYDGCEDGGNYGCNPGDCWGVETVYASAESYSESEDAILGLLLTAPINGGMCQPECRDFVPQALGSQCHGLALDWLPRTFDEPMLKAIYESPLPVVSAVNGPAAGAGANIALAADVVIASEAASFIQAFTRIGLMPDAGGTYWLPRQVGFARAMGMALFADKISARQAADWGMIWEAIAEVDFDHHWRARAAHLANGPTAAYRAVKRSLREGYSNELSTQLELEAELQGSLGQSHDFREGVTAFLEKRAPKFEGR